MNYLNGHFTQEDIHLVVQMVTHPPAMQETQVPSMGSEDPQEEGITTYSSILAWRIPMDRGAGGLQSMGSQKSQTRLST